MLNLKLITVFSFRHVRSLLNGDMEAILKRTSSHSGDKLPGHLMFTWSSFFIFYLFFVFYAYWSLRITLLSTDIFLCLLLQLLCHLMECVADLRGFVPVISWSNCISGAVTLVTIQSVNKLFLLILQEKTHYFFLFYMFGKNGETVPGSLRLQMELLVFHTKFLKVRAANWGGKIVILKLLLGVRILKVKTRCRQIQIRTSRSLNRYMKKHSYILPRQSLYLLYKRHLLDRLSKGISFILFSFFSLFFFFSKRYVC